MRKFAILLVCFFVLYFCSLAVAATYDATGTWNYSESNAYNNCLESNEPESGTVVISQSGNTFTITRGGDTISGTISGATYTANGSYPEDGSTTNMTVIFTLSSANSGTGTTQWTWGNYGCSGGSDITLTKQTSLPSLPYNITGTWNYSISGSYNNCGEPNENETGTIACSQSGSTFTISVNGDVISGTISGAVYTATDSYGEDGGTTTEIMVVTLSSSNFGSGTIRWVWNSGTESCEGGANISITKSSSNTAPATGGGGGGGGGGGCFLDAL